MAELFFYPYLKWGNRVPHSLIFPLYSIYFLQTLLSGVVSVHIDSPILDNIVSHYRDIAVPQLRYTSGLFHATLGVQIPLSIMLFFLLGINSYCTLANSLLYSYLWAGLLDLSLVTSKVRLIAHFFISSSRGNKVTHNSN
jgi:hypothetical protein